MIRRPPRSTRTDTLFPTRRSSDLLNTDHWLNALFNQPNQYQTRNEFFETVMINFDLHGNFYGLKTMRGNGSVTSILPIMAHQVEVHAQDDLVSDSSYIVTRGVKNDNVPHDRMWRSE